MQAPPSCVIVTPASLSTCELADAAGSPCAGDGRVASFDGFGGDVPHGDDFAAEYTGAHAFDNSRMVWRNSVDVASQGLV